MKSEVVQKYKGRSTTWLKKKARETFQQWIRERDTNKFGEGKCISSNRLVVNGSGEAYAGHYYQEGQYPSLVFDEDNVHLSRADNYFKHGNLIEYRKRLEKKIGAQNLESLDLRAEMCKRSKFKWNRLALIEVIEKYKEKLYQIQEDKDYSDFDHRVKKLISHPDLPKTIQDEDGKKIEAKEYIISNWKLWKQAKKKNKNWMSSAVYRDAVRALFAEYEIV